MPQSYSIYNIKLAEGVSLFIYSFINVGYTLS